MSKNNGDFVTEAKRRIPVYKKVGVVVCGGGPAGFAATVSAARNGADVLLVERNSFLGGTATAGFVNQFRAIYHINGIAREVVRRLGESGCCSRDAVHGYYDQIAFDQEVLKFIYMDMVEESGAKMIMNTWAVDAIVENQEAKGIIIENKSGRQAILANVVIDASGDADIAARAGVPFFLQETAKILPMFMLFYLGGINYQKIADYARENPKEFRRNSSLPPGDFDGDKNTRITGWFSLMKEAKERGELPSTINILSVEGITPFALKRGTGYIYGIQSVGRNPCNAQDISQAELETKKKVRTFLQFLKKVPGFESSFLINFAPNIAIGESRLIIGEYVLAEEDVFQSRIHDDDIALAVSIQPKMGLERRHPPDGSEGSDSQRRELEKLPYYLCCFGIPYRCLVPKKVDGLLVPGRNISSTHEVVFAGRMMPECIATGEAAGVAAAIAVKHGISPRQVDIPTLRKTLEGQGVNLRKDAIDLSNERKMCAERGIKLSN